MHFLEILTVTISEKNSIIIIIISSSYKYACINHPQALVAREETGSGAKILMLRYISQRQIQVSRKGSKTITGLYAQSSDVAARYFGQTALATLLDRASATTSGLISSREGINVPVTQAVHKSSCKTTKSQRVCTSRSASLSSQVEHLNKLSGGLAEARNDRFGRFRQRESTDFPQ